jgi:phosphate transport system substrate-binding protein
MFRAQLGTSRHKVRAAALSTGAVAGAIALSLSLAPVSGAATRNVVAKKSSVPSLTSLEKTLKGLENPPSGSVTLTENGSSLFTPLFEAWAAQPPFSSITIEPTISSSGTGVGDAINGTTNIGASDPYLPPADTTVINIPIVVGAQQVNYNIPGLKAGWHLRLSGTVLSEIYSGSITNWDSTQITKLNPGVKIPSVPIVTIHRLDSSGDTFNFLTYLADSDPTGFVAGVGGPQNSINWPSTPGALAASKNGGMLQTLQNTPGGIAYIGVSYLRQAIAANLGYALLENGHGKYVGPTGININEEVAGYTAIAQNGSMSLIYSKAKAATFGYPDVNFEYAVVKPSQSSSNTAQAIQTFLAWAMNPAQGSASSFLTPLYFEPLPPRVLQVSIALLKSVN